MTKLILTLLVATFVVTPGFSRAQDEGLEHLVIEMASTAAEHAAIARYYLTKAEEARQEMRRHEGMSRAYTVGKAAMAQRMRGHCERLAESYAEMAEEYEQLADLHEEESRTLE